MDPSRAFIKDAKRVVVKVGTAVVTRNDGRLALSRLGAICEQVRDLMSDGKEVIFVSSGAVEVGRQKLRHQRMMNSSFLELQDPEKDMDGKTCAAVGQSGLVALYDSLFSQLDVASSQLLVTDNEFRNPEFRQQLCETVNSLLALRVVPIFNENDAVSTRGSLRQDAVGTFCDNDSLAALLALENQADLLILLSDVEGLYSGPPSEPKSQLIHTYLREKHDDMITFGAKSRAGRGGMTAKVYAAWQAASAGIPVVICSGRATDVLQRVMQGDLIGTLFHKDAHRWVDHKETGAGDMVVAARDGIRHLRSPSSEEQYSILQVVADAVLANEAKIKAENSTDVGLAQTRGISRSLMDRYTTQSRKIAALANSLRTLADMKQPVGEVLKCTEVAEGLIPEETSCPSGVVLVVFESLPDAPVQVASPVICSGEGLLLKGGAAGRSDATLQKVECSMTKLPGALTNPFCANGVCHVFVDKAADLDKAKRIVLDSKVDNPASCNALETLLVHEDLVGTGGLEKLTFALQSAGVILYGGTRASELLKLPRATGFHVEYSALACTVEVVKDVQAAIDHIHEHGSAHTDSIVTENQSTADIFLHHVHSATVFHNCSTRFSDGGRIGLGAEVGISTGRIHARGPVGFEGLFTTRWLLRGNGQLVNGDRGVKYTHRNLPIGEDGVRALPYGIVNGPYQATHVSNGSV